ncbi:MAG: branched-chain amino acid ABC transporter permease [Planctomycetota bacterium]|jgi:branched-chain amino acid transport system permease protein|nr:branched-chain amino acid ABC transporter permease [Planctomycetota bacterium]
MIPASPGGWARAAGLALAGVLPFLLDNNYVFHLLAMSGIYMVLAMSLNLLIGFTGLFSLGHAAFYGLGAYASALLTQDCGLPFPAAFALSGLLAAAFGAAVGFPALRLRAIFLAIATMGLNEIVRLFLTNLDGLTGGPAGLPGIPEPDLWLVRLGQPRDFYVAAMLLAAGTYLVLANILSGRPGRALIAIRDDETAARSIGVDVTAYKVAAFGVSAFFAGLAGSFFAHYLTYISPDSFGLSESFAIIAMVSLGGLGNLRGSLWGAFLLCSIPEIFRSLQDFRELIYGLTLVLIIRVLPDGIADWRPLAARWRQWRSGPGLGGEGGGP